MAEHPGINLMVIHILVEHKVVENIVRANTDEEFMSEIKLKASGNNSIRYYEKVVRDIEETIPVVRELCQCSLILVG